MTATTSTGKPVNQGVTNGDFINYKLTVTNGSGKITAQNVDIKDAIPNYTTFAGAAISGACV